MRDPILSLRVWSYYELLVGVAIAAVPNTLLDLMGIPAANEVWIRVAGLVAIALGFVYWGGARGRSLDVVRASVFGRLVIVVGLVALAITGGPWQLVLFALVDLLGLVWSWRALRTEAAAPA